MIGIVKAQSPWIAAGVLVWLVYPAIGTDGKTKEEGRRKAPEIRAEDIRLRVPDEALVLPSDPCRQSSGQPSGPLQDPATAEAEGADGAAADGEARAGAEGQIESAPVLRLESVLYAAGDGVAIVNRQALRRGERILGVDPDAPPLVEEIGSTWIRVSYAGRQHRLDLDAQPEIRLERTRSSRKEHQ